MKKCLSFVFVSMLLIAGCATIKGFTVTGESLKGVGEEFIAVSAVYKSGCDAGQIAPADCAKYRDFGVKFKQQYPLAIALWESARVANDGAAEKQTREAIVKLATELSVLAVQAYAAFGGK